MAVQKSDSESILPGTSNSHVLPGPALAPSRRRGRHREWRAGGSGVREWNLRVLVVGAVATFAGLAVGAAVSRLSFPGAWMSSSVFMWLGMGGAVAFAVLRGRPAGLLSFRPPDLVWGLALGLVLRGLQGWSGHANTIAFPAASAGESGLSIDWWLSVALPAGIVAPIIEELFFRGLVLVSTYQVFRRSVGSVMGGVTALLVSSGAFVLLHAASGVLPLFDGIQFFVVGFTCSLLVLLTGRIGGALLAHIVYNSSYLVLILIGTVLS